jgi:hypothetical protein
MIVFCFIVLIKQTINFYQILQAWKGLGWLHKGRRNESETVMKYHETKNSHTKYKLVLFFVEERCPRRIMVNNHF